MNLKKDLTPFTIIEAGHSRISLSLTEFILMVSVKKSLSKNLTLEALNTHFSGFRKRSFSLSLSMTR